MSIKQNPQDRVRNALADTKAPYVCPECGSTFFVQSYAYQYVVSDYAIRGASESPQQLHACIGCGNTLIPGSLKNIAHVGGEREAFLNSVDLGKAYKVKHDPSQIIKNTASITEVEQLKADIEHLRAIVEGLLEVISSQEIEEPTEVKESVPVEKITRKTIKEK